MKRSRSVKNNLNLLLLQPSSKISKRIPDIEIKLAPPIFTFPSVIKSSDNDINLLKERVYNDKISKFYF